MVDTKWTIKGFLGATTQTFKRGTLKWKWEDDRGITHTFLIPGTFYIPDTNQRLLSPQHWAQTQKDKVPIQGTGETTNANEVTLYWKQRAFKKTRPISTKNNVATFMTTAGYKKYTEFVTESNIENEDTCEIATSVMEDEEPA